MIYVDSVTVSPSVINIEIGEWYYGVHAEICPPDATKPLVKWSSSNPSIASVGADSGYIYGNSTGTATIYATALDGSGKRDCCTVVVSETVPVSEIKLNYTNLNLRKGNNRRLIAKIFPTNATNQSIQWSSDNPNIATVDDKGVVQAKKKGITKITASAVDGSGITAHCYITVFEYIFVSSITISPSCTTLYVGKSIYLHETVYPEDAENKDVVWRSDNTKVATVNSTSGLVTAHSEGTATIYATAKDGSKITGSCTVVVKLIPVKSITLDVENIVMQKGDTRKLSATVCPENASYKNPVWTSDNTDVAIVINGVVAAKASGTTIIKASANDGSGKYANCRVAVTDGIPVTDITIEPSSITMRDTDMPSVVCARVLPRDAGNCNVTWSSDTPDVAEVDEFGKVYPFKIGNATITATAADGSGVQGHCLVTVEPTPVTGITLPQKILVLNKEDKDVGITATIRPSKATNKSVRWRSKNQRVATIEDIKVDKFGTALAVVNPQSEGNTEITATTIDGGFQASCMVTVNSKKRVEIVKDGEYFNVQFSDGLIWKIIGCDLSQTDYFRPEIIKERYRYNCEKNFSMEQLAFLYLLDPLGIEYYVTNIYTKFDGTTTDLLFWKDQLYERIFGERPKFFRKSPSGAILYYTNSGNATREFRETVYSSAEVLFGAHVIYDWAALITFVADVLPSIFSEIPVIDKIMMGVELYQALFFSGSITGSLLSGASVFLSQYALLHPAVKMLEWVATICHATMDSLYPNIDDVNIYKKVAANKDYNVYFGTGNSYVSMDEIISRCEN